MELSLQSASASMTLFHLTEMNTALLDLRGSVLLLHEREPMPEFAQVLQQEDFARVAQQSQKHPHACCIYTNAWGLSYASAAIRTGKEIEGIAVVGPFLQQVPDAYALHQDFHGHPSRLVRLQDFYRGLKLISHSKLQSIANVLLYFGAIPQAPLVTAEHRYQADRCASPKAGQLQSNQQPADNEAELIELRYKLETQLMHAVKKGDRDAIREINRYSKNLFDFSERFPNQPIRALRNMLIVLNTLLRIAARNGKVHPVYLHRLSEKFAKQIERSESIDALNSLSDQMYNEYCALVERHSAAGYSAVVTQAIQYLKVHMGQTLDLTALSEHCHVHPSHLSRQFKKETGLTLTEYLNRERIEQAKLLLSSERASIDWIAGYVGFEDAGYFTRVFKKLTGLTPTQFRAE